jgi:[ribosomal protein S5]-alanine N-acetyltransferase
MRGSLGGRPITPDREVLIASRVELHVPHLRDQAAWRDLVHASRSFHAGWVSTAATARAFAAYLARAKQPSGACRLIRRRADGALVGAINLTEIVRGSLQSGYLGYYIGTAYAGQGYMTEALQLMLRLAFRQLRLHRVEANIQPANHASLRLVQRAGFRREGYSRRYLKIAGRWRDHERWALLVEDWRPLGERARASRGAT